MPNGEEKKQGKQRQDKKSWGNFGQPRTQQESGWTKAMHVLFPISNLHSGGTVKKTGVFLLKKGEKVLTIAQQKAAGIKPRSKKASRKRVASKA